MSFSKDFVFKLNPFMKETISNLGIGLLRVTGVQRQTPTTRGMPHDNGAATSTAST